MRDFWNTVNEVYSKYVASLEQAFEREEKLSFWCLAVLALDRNKGQKDLKWKISVIYKAQKWLKFESTLCSNKHLITSTVRLTRFFAVPHKHLRDFFFFFFSNVIWSWTFEIEVTLGDLVHNWLHSSSWALWHVVSLKLFPEAMVFYLWW